jgi:hypothetical protein
VQRRRKHDLQVLLVQRIERASEDSREVFGFDERHCHADQTCTDSGSDRALAVGREAQVSYRAQHHLAGIRCHVGSPVEDPRDGGDRDTGRARYVPDRGASTLALLGVIGDRSI